MEMAAYLKLAFFVYREFLARFFVSLHDHQVTAVREVDHDIVEISLKPLGRYLDSVPGQFAMIYPESTDGPSRRWAIARRLDRRRLTTEKVLTAVGGDTTALSVFMCGPTAMVESFQSGFRTAGVHGRQIYREYIDWR